MIRTMVDRLLETYSRGENEVEVVRAREEYFERGGRVFDDDNELFENRIAAFFEWYVIERPWKGGPPPVVHALQTDLLPLEARPAAALLASSHHSLFDLISVANQLVEVEDLLGGARFSVVERRSTAGFVPGDVFEARVMWDEDAVVFGKTFLYHPRDARDVVLDLAEAAVHKGTPHDEILFQLARLQLRWHRTGHINAARIYKGEL